MAHRSTVPARIHLVGNSTRCKPYIPFGRTLLGSVIEVIESGGIDSHSIVRRIGEVTIEASYAFGNAVITITSPFGSSQDEDIPVLPEVWVPRGFVFCPVSDTSVRGWGVPSILGGDMNPFSEYNLAPGLDTARWTAGGVCGQVLVTQLPNAGYPEAKPESLVAPMLFHFVYGLRPQKDLPALGTTWDAYRLEFVDYSAQSPDAGRDAGALAQARTFKQEMFDLVNDLRVSNGRTPMILPIRGFYDSAQATAESMHAAAQVAHFSEDFPPTYETTGDRAKDGRFKIPTVTYGIGLGDPADAAAMNDRNLDLDLGENLNGSGSIIPPSLPNDPYGVERYNVSFGPVFTAQESFDLFLTSAGHTANMNHVQYNTFSTGVSNTTELKIGFKFASYAQHFHSRMDWLMAGNKVWYSQHAEIPALSTDSYNQMNLAWETWPVRMVRIEVTPPFPEDPYFDVNFLYVGRRFTAATVTDAAHIATLAYTDKPGGDVDRRNRLSLSHAIYMRGRNIAVAPDAGLVWAAAVQKLAAPSDGEPQMYRLVVLTHHSEDQGDYEFDIDEGHTRFLRVWYIDVPDLFGYPMNPQTVIRGVYGEEDLPNDWPWITTNSPYSWRGGTLVDVSDSEVMLKYASVWKFNPAGTKAVCLRDYGDIDEWKDEWITGQSDPPGAGPLGPTLSGPTHLPGGQLGVMTGGKRVRYIELDVSDPESPIMTTSTENAGGAPQAVAATYAAAATGGVTPAAWVRPAAVDYDTNGNLIFAFHVIVYYAGAYEPVDASGTAINNQRHGIYFTDDWDVTYPVAGPGAIWYSSLVAHTEDLMGPIASVIDVRDKVWAHVGTPCFATDSGVGSNPSAPDYPLYVPDGADVFYRECTYTADCLACTQIPATHTIRMYRNGVQILENTIDNDDDLVHDFRLFPQNDYLQGFQCWALNPALQATYARERAGAWAATLSYIPQAAETFRFVPDGSGGNDWGHQCYNSCGDEWDSSTNRLTILFAQNKNLGGSMTSSFAPDAALASLMNVPGDNPRSPYVRIV